MTTVTEMIAAQAAATPGATAVVAADGRLTYRELADRVARRAHWLGERGAGPGRRVAVLMPRSAGLVVTLLAVLRTGAGYVPVAPDDPEPRVRHILADADPTLIVTAETLGELPGERYEGAGPGPGDVAYVIYTSGSTGRPKGVVVEHRALAAYLGFARDTYPGLAGTALLHSAISFDLAVTSLFGPLTAGGAVAVADLRALADGGRLPAGADRPTFLKVTPSHLPLLQLLPVEHSPATDLVIGGEALHGDDLRPWRAAHPGVTVFNEYGPTEATVGCCVHRIGPGAPLAAGPVPIGRPTPGTELSLLDPAGRPVPDGEPGELSIAGSQLARGYRNAPELTAERFADGRYRTGDACRRRPGGELEYLGRLDEQVKINGYRVEPGEVRAALRGLAGVADCAVLAVPGAGGGNQLVAYVTGGADPRALRDELTGSLPGYLVPSRIEAVAELPLTAGGKLDRSRLAEPAPTGPPASPTELLQHLIGQVVGVPRVGPDDDFLDLGGTSIAAAKIVTRARRAGLRISLADLLRERTVRRVLRDMP